MSDSYQAVYDATRSRVGGVDVGGAVERVAREAFDMGHTRAILQQEIVAVSHEMQRPSVLFRPALYPDGDQWCALYGRDLMEGIAGFGNTPSEAMASFDLAFWNERAQPTGQTQGGAV